MTGRNGVLAFDVGGTRIKAAVVDDHGVPGEILVADTPPDVDPAVDRIRELARVLSQGVNVTAAGLCVPGLVDDDGRVLDLPGKLDGIVGRDLPGELADIAGSRPIVTNDAVAFGAGEALAGAGRGFTRVVVMTVGTGVGVAVFDRGRPVTTGPLGAGIQGGQIPIGPAGASNTDTSGHTDTIEAHCRARRIVDFANEAGGSYASPEDVLTAHTAGAADAVAAIDRYRTGLVLAVRALANAHGADAVIIGGGPLVGDAPLLDGVEDAVQRELWSTHRLSVRRAVLGDAAALVGVSLLAGA